VAATGAGGWCLASRAARAADSQRASDPWLSTGPEGTTYLGTLPGTGVLPGAPALLVNRSRDGGRSWSRPVYIDRRADPVAANDKPAVTADRYRPGVAYVVWVRFRLESAGATLDLYFSRSRNRGRSWSRPARIYEASLNAAVTAPEVIVTGRRRLICLFSTVESRFGSRIRGGRISFLALRSHDGGRSWSGPARIGTTRHLELTDPERGTEVRAPSPVFSAAGGPQGRVYVAWQDVRSSRSSRILLSSSRGGRRWSRPRLASRGAKAPFTPDLAVARDGIVGVCFYDQRRDRLGDVPLTTDSWFRHSHDRGRHWREARLDRSFDLRTAPVAGGLTPGLFLGDYQAVVALPGGFATVFARARPAARQGPSDIFFARIKLRP
jgi:hypothetical protein